jgi:hypothetical protein
MKWVILIGVLFLLGAFVYLHNLPEKTIVEVTGMVVDHSGLINITIDNVVLINFTDDDILWDTGSVYGNASYAILDTLGNVTNGTWLPVSVGFTIRNIGNSNLSISFMPNKNADSFIGGTNPYYKFMITDVEDGACATAVGINFDLELKVPADSNIGLLEDTVTIAAQLA